MRIFLILLLLIISSYVGYMFITTTSIEIDKIYVINLDRSYDRYTHIKKQLDKMNLPVEYTRFSAFDGNNIELVNRVTQERIQGSEIATKAKLLKGEFDIICSKEWPGNLEPLNVDLIKISNRLAGEIGCTCSHKKIWEDIINNGYKNVLILEDDAFLSTYFDKYLSMALKFVPENYDLIYLAVVARQWNYKIKIPDEYINEIFNKVSMYITNIFFKQIRRDGATTSAYIISQDGAKKIINASYYVDGEAKYAADGILGSAVSRKILTAYVIKPLIVQQKWDKISSDIDAF